MSPKQQERRFKPQYAHTLLDIAEGDFRTAEFTAEGFAGGKIRPENVFFLYQQAMEKALKAGYEITQFNDFAGVRRYEEGSIVYQSDDLDDAHELAQRILTWARSVVRAA